MSAPDPARPDRDDDLEAAYAQAQALADDGRGPPASVRANVLAAASEAAAGFPTAAATPPLAPVAPPVAAVGRGRSLAVNLSSWGVRAGAAACAALLVGLGVWRFDAGHRAELGAQVATASLELAAPPTRALPKDLPPAPRVAASPPYLAPPPVVVDPVDRAPGANAAAAARDRQVIVAQADQAERAPRPAPSPEARVEAVPAAPVAAAPDPRTAQAPAPALTARTRIAAVTSPTQFATRPPKAPSVLPRRVAVAPAAEPASGERNIAATASALPRRVDIAAASSRQAEAAGGAPPAPDAVGKPSAAAADSAQARRPTTLQAAADRGDVEALRALLAGPAVRVDAPDADGRTALLHAVLAQQVAAARLLIAAGADPDRADQAGLTPRAAALGGANAEIAGLLAAPR